MEELRNRALKLYNETNDYKYSLIMKILQNDSCFVEMSIDDAISILMDLSYTKEQAKNEYIRLVNEQMGRGV